MMIVCFMVFFLVVFIEITILYVAANRGEFLSCYCSFLSGAVVAVCVIFMSYSKEPSAMDVYLGDTTLKVTYVDSIPTDSVVVFKK